jgi:hypothetical protein
MHPTSISRRFALVAAASTLATMAAAPAFAAGKDDFVIVPGKSFGPIKKGATLARLEKIYGKANLRVRTVQPPHADLPKQRAAVIFPGTPNEAVVLLTRANRAEGVIVEKAGGKWATKEGLRVGLAVEEMERRYGGPFAITGFGQDGGGAVNREPAKAPARALYIRFTSAQTEKVPDADEAVLNAEKGFRSDHPAARRAKLKVSVIWWDLTR